MVVYSGSSSDGSPFYSSTKRRARYIESIPSYICDTTSQVLLFILPSFFAQRYTKLPTKSLEPSRTAYLNGLRGIFALIVFIENFSSPWHKGIHYGYGHGSNQSWLQLPIIRALYAGPSVAIFFAVSGYVNSHRHLIIIRNRAFDRLGTSLTLSVFRRGPRLFLPSLVSSLYVAAAAQFGLLGLPAEAMSGFTPVPTVIFNSWSLQIQDWARFLREELTNTWDWSNQKSTYDSNLWTIPVQFRAATIIFVVLLGTSRLSPGMRKYSMVLLFVYWMLQGHWEVAAFLGGMFRAERDVEESGASNIQLDQGTTPKPNTKSIKRYLANCYWLSCLLASLYLGSFPQLSAETTPGYIWLSVLSTNDNAWKTYSALLLLYTLSHSASIQQILNLPFIQYLGEISYAIYLVQGPVLHTFGYRLAPFVWSYIGNGTNLQSHASLIIAFLALIPIVVCIADVFRRVVEKPCIEFTSWFERAFFVRDR